MTRLATLLVHDLRFATRTLAKRPAFAVVGVLTLALGIGANSAIFSVADAVLLRDPPWAEPERLALILGSRPATGADRLPLSYPNFADLAARAGSFEGMAAWNSSPGTTLPLTGRGDPEQVRYAAVSASLFDVLGVRPAMGRGFSAEDDVEGAAVVVVGYDFWVRRLGADPDALGASLRLGGRAYTVVGVLPADFRFIAWPAPPQVWLPLAADPSVPGGNRSPRWARGANYLGVVGRLGADASAASAQAEIDVLTRAIAGENPGMNRELSFHVLPLREQVVGGLRATLLLLLGAVGLVLLIACANVANLMLARGAERAREIAVRFALGASRRRVAAQLLAESLVLAVAGGVLGVVLAAWAVDVLAANPFGAPDPFVPFAVDAAHIRIDARVLAFTLMLTLLTAGLFGLAPALHGARRAPFDALRDGGRASTSPAGRRARDLLVVAEVALAVPLLTGAALLVSSLIRLQRVDAGFDPGSTLAVELEVRGGRYAAPAQVAAFYDALLARIAVIPGVAGAGALERLPLTGPQQSTDFRIDGEAPVAPGERPNVAYASVTPGALEALRVPLRGGRSFSSADDAQAARVALINETAAARFFPGVDPVGRRIALTVEALRFGPDGPPTMDFDGAFREIVGVVADLKHEGLAAQARPAVYVPFAQRLQGDMSVVVRARAGSVGLAAALRDAVRAVDRDQPVIAMSTLDDVVSRALGAPRFRTHLLATFALLAAALAAIGLYGVLAFAVSQRTHELGVRIAFGARPREIFGLVTARALRLVAAGIMLGLIAAAALTRLLESLLFEVGPLDPLAFAAAPLLLSIVALLASVGPARRATRVDPLVALRAE